MLFFFSSRRRHTRFKCDWSSDVCSSDLCGDHCRQRPGKFKCEVFPVAAKARTPIVAFTATRWGTLLEPYATWPGPPPTAPDCYRYCLAQPSVRVVLTAPRSLTEL